MCAWKTESGGEQFKKEKEETDKSTVPCTGFFTPNACAKNGARGTREVTNNLSSGVPSRTQTLLLDGPALRTRRGFRKPTGADVRTGGPERALEKPHQSHRLWSAPEGKRANRWAKRPGAGTKVFDPEPSARPGRVSASPRGSGALRGHTECCRHRTPCLADFNSWLWITQKRLREHRRGLPSRQSPHSLQPSDRRAETGAFSHGVWGGRVFS